MARYRNIQMSFWTDSKVADEFTPEDKFFYLYLLTNPLTTLTGCYEVSKKQMSIDTGYTKETVNKLLDRLDKQHHVIKYSPETKEVLIINWGKYNWTSSPKLRSSVSEQIKLIKDQNFRDYVLKKFNGDTVSIPYPYGSDTSDSLVSDSLGINNINNLKGINNLEPEKNAKQDPAEEEFQKLWELYPRKKGKNAVSKAAKKEIHKLGYAIMAECIRLYCVEVRGKDEQYILHGSTFFNGRYQDYVETARRNVEHNKSRAAPEDDEPSAEWLAMFEEED